MLRDSQSLSHSIEDWLPFAHKSARYRPDGRRLLRAVAPPEERRSAMYVMVFGREYCVTPKKR